jgi:accessory gene regulator protein AgrB
MMAGVAYLLMTIFYFFTSLFVFKYAKSIKKAVNLGGSEHVEDALKAQASFWKLVGILTLVMFVLMILAMVFGVGSAMMGMKGMGLPAG